jgi:type VI secretion system secreted protein VgrG
MAHDGGSGTTHGTLDKVDYEFTCEDGPSGRFRVYRMRLMEDLNGCYELDLDLVTDELDADTDKFLGAACQLEISRKEHTRSVYGIVMAVSFVGRSHDYLVVNVQVVPAMYLLGQQTHSRIFQDLTVLQILDEVLGAALADYGRTLDKGSEARGTSPRDYCVQYGETDLAFAVRLMEEEGINYGFVHDPDKGHEVLTLAYANEDYPNAANVDGTPLVPIIVDRPETADVESIRHLDWLQTLTTTASMRRDFDFMVPLEPLEAIEEHADPKGRVRREYHHMDRRYIADDLQARSVDRVQTHGVRAKLGRGTSNVVDFVPGKVFELERHFRDDLETRFLLTRVVHTGECPEEVLVSESRSGAAESRYHNSFHCIRLDTPLRPRRSVPKPRTHGPETAIVAGPPGEEIHVDEHGRIKVQFHWEEGMTYDDTSSCWVRVRQPWGGGGWGHQFIPRIGMEVLVEFLGGDPDRPVVTGCFYNGDNGYPYAMPGSKTKSGIKTNTVSGEGSNELRFEDMAGSEEVYIHAQKDFNEVVEHDHSTTVHNNQSVQVDVDQSTKVDANQTNTVGGNQTESVTGNQTMSVDGIRTVTIKGSQAVTIDGNKANSGVSGSKLTITGDYKVDASNTIEIQAPTHIKLTCGGSTLTMVPGKITLTAGGAATVVLDANALMQSAAGTKVLLDANALAQSSGGSKVLLDANALAQSSGGSKVLLDGNALMSSPADAKVEAPTSSLVGGGGSVEANGGGVVVGGDTVSVTGSSGVTVTGATVKIN